jgi:hypothetical protein
MHHSRLFQLDDIKLLILCWDDMCDRWQPASITLTFYAGALGLACQAVWQYDSES